MTREYMAPRATIYHRGTWRCSPAYIVSDFSSFSSSRSHVIAETSLTAREPRPTIDFPIGKHDAPCSTIPYRDCSSAPETVPVLCETVREVRSSPAAPVARISGTFSACVCARALVHECKREKQWRGGTRRRADSGCVVARITSYFLLRYVTLFDACSATNQPPSIRANAISNVIRSCLVA